MNKKFFPDRRIRPPFFIALLGMAAMIITLFLPYASAIGDHAKELSANADAIMHLNLGITAKDMMNISMVDFARLYNSLSSSIFGNNEGSIYIVLVALIGGFSLLSALFVIFKKATPAIVFTMLSFLVFAFQNYDFEIRNIINGETYNWGFGYYIFYAATVLALAGAVWLLITKIRIKKENKA